VSAYLDASVLLPALVEEAASAAVDAYLLHESKPLLVSDFAAAEVASGLSRLVRMRLFDGAAAAARIEEFDIWRAAATTTVDLHAADARLAYLFVRRFALLLRAPDALHLAIARRLDATLVTLDRRLVRAAEELEIPVAMPQH
jgi:predicted nucleic acid-binding protein